MPTSEFNMAAQCINRKESVVIYCLLLLLFVCLSINSVVHTVLSNPICGHDTTALFSISSPGVSTEELMVD